MEPGGGDVSAATTFGYSGKTLGQKLGIKPGDVVRPIGAPDHYASLVAPLPEGATIVEGADQPAIVHAFVRSAAELEALAEALVAIPRPGGSLWISWPKKSSPLFAGLTEDGVRKAVLPTGWVDVKVCAVDTDWSGLKFLRRRS
jgi:hypothetical protein